MTTQKLPRRNIDHPFVTRLEAFLLVLLVILAISVVFLLLRDLSGVAGSGTLPTQAAVAVLSTTTPTQVAPAMATSPPDATPTLIAAATETAVYSTPACTYDMRFIGDVTVPDDTVLLPGAGFVKTWRIQNSGTCPWEAGTSWIFVDGQQMNGPHTARF